jgi:hypothetical protein
MQNLIPLFAIVGTFSSIIIFFYLFFNSRHKERMALIQHNKDADIFIQRSTSNALGAFKYGMVAVGIGLGIFLAALIDNLNLMDPEPAYFGMMLFMGGLGLLVYYFVVRMKKENKETV